MSLSSNRSTGSGSSDDFVVHTAHHTPLGRSELETTFLHPNCDCGSAKDTKNVLMCTEYEREYRNKSPLGQRRKTDSSTATPNGDVTCALDKLLVDECDAVDDKVSTLKESASLQNKKQSKRLLFRPLQQEKKQSHEKKQNQQKQSQQKQPQQKNLPPFHPPLPPPSRVQNQQHHLHHPDEKVQMLPSNAGRLQTRGQLRDSYKDRDRDRDNSDRDHDRARGLVQATDTSSTDPLAVPAPVGVSDLMSAFNLENDPSASNKTVAPSASVSASAASSACLPSLLVSDTVVLERLKALWNCLIATCQALALHGYERTAIAASLPHFQQHRLDHHCHYLYERCQKRISPAWQQSEPTEVVLLCRALVQCYDDLIAVATGTLPSQLASSSASSASPFGKH